MRHRIYFHIVWTTRHRAPLLDAGLARFLCRFLRQVARDERAHILEIGMVTTHLHLLARAHPMTNLGAAVAAPQRRQLGDGRQRAPFHDRSRTQVGQGIQHP